VGNRLVETFAFSVQPLSLIPASEPRMCLKLSVSLAVLMGCVPPTFAQTSAVPSTKSIEVVPPERSEFPDIPPLPKSSASLLGGTVRRVDPIHDRILLRAFGGGDFTIDFDSRTRVMRGATPAQLRDVRAGTRIYVDSIPKDGRVFAKTLHLESGGSILGETKGQVLSYDEAHGLLKVRDIISAQPLNLRVTPRTEIRSGDQGINASDLVAGSLVKIRFQGVSDGPSVAEKIDVMARPGSSFVFTGRIAVIDLRDSHLTLDEQSGQNTFEVGLHSLPASEKLRLKQGSDVVVHAEFDGTKYEAKKVEPVPPQ
jgi:uncharacterized protein DUF5666